MRNKFAKFAALAVCAGFASCSEYDAGIDPMSSYEIAYEAAFIKTFGQPAADQDWGFGSDETRASQPNSNQWGTDDDNGKYKDYPKPADITDEERAAVLAVFNQKGEEHYESLLDLRNFFVQQVYCGPKGNAMQQLAAIVDYKTEIVSYWPYEEKDVTCEPFHDEFNNFNGGAYSGNTEQGCMLMWNSATTDFGFKTSDSNGQWIDGHWRMEYIAPYGYFVGFDHESWSYANNDNENNDRDYVYNDWIVKIVPGLGYSFPTPETPTDKGFASEYRIIAEDLSAQNSSDFDFNDIVIDVQYSSDKTQTRVVLKAAGGTLPLRIERYDAERNLQKVVDISSVKEEMGLQASTMFNTTNIDPSFEKELIAPFDGLLSKEDANELLQILVQKDDGQWHPLTANKGKVACKICVEPSFNWCEERQPLKETYPKFQDWVQTGSDVIWY